MIPIKLNLTNFLSHDRSEVDFTRFNTALILGSYDGDFSKSNGSGKSSIFRGLSYALFERTDSKKKDGVVKQDKKYCKVEFVFESDGQTYRITRKRDKVISESEVILEQLQADQITYKDISCDTNTATNEKLETLIGLNYEVFVNSVYFKQNDVSLFADSTPGKRKDIIKSLLRIERWDEYQKRAKDRAKSLLTRIDEKRNSSISIDSLQDQLKTTDKHAANVRDEIAQHNIKHDRTSEDLILKRSVFQSRFGEDNNDLVNRLKQLTKEYAATQERIKNNQVQIKTNTDVITQAQKVEPLLKANIKALTDKIKEGKSIDLNRINASLLTGRTKERVLRGQIQTLEAGASVGQKCPVCRKPITKQDLQHLQEELDQIKQQHTETKTKLQAAERKAQDLQRRSEVATKAEVERGKLELKLSRCQSALIAAQKENEQLTQQNQDLYGKDYPAQIQELKIRISGDESAKFETELTTLEQEASSLRTMIDRLNIEYGSLIKSKENLIRQIAQQTQLQEELNKLNAEYAIYDKLRDYFGKDGIQSVIIENIIDELENYTNDILAKICNEPTIVSINTQKQSENGNWQEAFDIEINMSNRTDDIASFSGGEKFRVSMALRLALSRILAKRMGGTVRFLLLDEVAVEVDEAGKALFVSIIKQLSQEMKILIITHDQSLKEQFDDVIIVNKTAEGSKIIQNY